MIEALTSDQVRNYAIGGVIGLVVLGLIVGFLISALVGRVIVLVVVVALAAVLVGERSKIANDVKKCQANITFLGVHVGLTAKQEATCKAVTHH